VRRFSDKKRDLTNKRGTRGDVMRHTSGILALALGTAAMAGSALAPASVLAQTPPAAVPVPKGQEASSALLRGNVAQALALYSDSLKDNTLPNDRRAAILNDRGVAYHRLGQTKLAIDDFNRAVQLFPEYAAVYNNRGNTLMALGVPREAIKDFDRAILLAPGYAAAFNNRAGAALRLGQNADAIRDYTKAIELMPTSPAPLSGRGRVYLAEARPHAAMRDFSRALQSDARFSAGYRARAEAKIEIERYEEAVEDLSRAIAFEPGNPEVLTIRGQAYLANKNPASAIKDFSRAIELDPRSVPAHLGRALANLKAEAYEESEADITRALELDPRSALAFAYRALVYKATAQPDLGAKEIDKAMKLEPERPEVLWAKGEIEEALGRTDEAIGALRKALLVRPGMKDASDVLERLGVGQDTTGETEVRGAGVAKWRVVTKSGRFFAVNDDLPKLRVALEMVGEGQPKLLEWDAKRKEPFREIGTLRFSAGKSGNDAVEQIAIINTQAPAALLGIEPHRVGEKVSQWTWDDGRIVVASVDGVTDEFVVRVAEKPKDAKDSKEPRDRDEPAAKRRVASDNDGRENRSSNSGNSNGGSSSKSQSPSWAPWAQDRQPQRTAQQPRPSGKPKTFFDILLGN
jgi:tetratricopeptide (TPR) repeat protein